jgi:hypothetical protein
MSLMRVRQPLGSFVRLATGAPRARPMAPRTRAHPVRSRMPSQVRSVSRAPLALLSRCRGRRNVRAACLAPSVRTPSIDLNVTDHKADTPVDIASLLPTVSCVPLVTVCSVPRRASCVQCPHTRGCMALRAAPHASTRKRAVWALSSVRLALLGLCSCARRVATLSRMVHHRTRATRARKAWT